MVVVVKATGCTASVVTGVVTTVVTNTWLTPSACFSISPLVKLLSLLTVLLTVFLLDCVTVVVAELIELDVTSFDGEFFVVEVVTATFFTGGTSSFAMRSTLTTGLVFAFRNVRDDELVLQLVLLDADLPDVRTEFGTCLRLALVGGLFADDVLPKLVTGKDNVFASSEFNTLDDAACCVATVVGTTDP